MFKYFLTLTTHILTSLTRLFFIKLSQKGSVTTESGVRRKVDIKESDGTQHIEEDISLEKISHSKSKGEDTQSTLHVSIVREKRAVSPYE